MTGARTALIGVGNELRRDDGVGPALVATVAAALPPGVRATVAADPGELLDLWSGLDLAVVVDAVVCAPSTPGRVHRYELELPPTADADPDRPPRPGSGGTHSLDVAQLARLAQALGRAPRRLVVFGVEAGDLAIGEGLTAEVAAGLPALGRQVLAEIAAADPS